MTKNLNIYKLHRNAYKLLSSIKTDSSSSPVIIDSAFFDSFTGNVAFDRPYENRRFRGSRLKFSSTLSLGFDAESFFLKLQGHLKEKGLDVSLFAISVLPFFNPLKICTGYRVCGLLELDKQIDTSCPMYFSPPGFIVAYTGFGDSRLPLSSHLTRLIVSNQRNAHLHGWFYITPGWLSNEQTSQLMWASAVTKNMEFMFELVGLNIISGLGPVVHVHPSCLTLKTFDVLYAFSVFRKESEVKLDHWLSQDNSLSKSILLSENDSLITSLYVKTKEYDSLESKLFQLKQYVPKECISWSL
jgi:hypothetical protein